MAGRRDLVWIFGGRLVTALVSIITLRLATTFLSPLQYGGLALLTAVQTFCGLLLVNPVGQYINRHTHGWADDGTLLAQVKAYNPYLLLVSAVGAAAAAVAGSGLPPLHAALAVFAIVLTSSWNATLVPMLNLLGSRRAAVAWSVATSVAGLASSAALILVHRSLAGWIVGQALGMGLGGLGAYLSLRRTVQGADLAPARFFLTWEVAKRFCLPLAVATGLMWLQFNGYRFIVEWGWGLATLGSLAVGLTLAAQLWSIIEGLAHQFLMPYFYRRISHGDRVGQELALADLVNILAPIYIVIAAAAVCAADSLIMLLTARQFHQFGFFVAIGSLVECARAIGNLLANGAQIDGRPRILWLSFAAGSAITVLATGTLAAIHVDARWISGSLMAGAAALLIGLFARMKHEFPFRLDARRWLACLALLLLATLSHVAVPHPGVVAWAVGKTALTGVLAVMVVAALLRKNAALGRMLGTKL